MNKLTLVGVSVLLCASLSACHDDDPNYDQSLPPVVDVAPSTLSGVVTTVKGEPVSGATITFGSLSATTNADGYYLISGIGAGTTEITISAQGMITKKDHITVESVNPTQNVTYSAILNKEISNAVNVTVNEGGAGSVESEAITGNVKGEIEMTMNVPSNTVPENTTITISPIYTEESAMIVRAASETMLIGANITCSDPNLRLTSPLTVSFAVDKTVIEHVEIRQYVNGAWVVLHKDEDYISNDNGIVVSTKHIAPIGLFFSVDVTETRSSVALTFTPSLWNNLYGEYDITAGEATFTYKSGSEYNTVGATTLEALLIERLASIVGPTVKEMQGNYPLNVVLPIGTAIGISGSQATTRVSVASRGHIVSALRYGTVTVTTHSYNRQHNGGIS